MIKNQKDIWNSSYKQGLNWKKLNKIDKCIKGKKILELGVGNGKTLKAILEQKPKKVVAIDISEEAISLVRKLINSKKVSYIEEDFLKIKFKDKFDTITCYYFLNNLKERERKKAVENMKAMLNKKGIILFEDFAVGDMREKGKKIEENTIQKQNGLICHFFDKAEIKELFRDFDIKIEEKIFAPIRKDVTIKRKIIKANIRTR